MHSQHVHRNVTWLDFESPSRDEIRDVVDRFGIDPLVAEELLLPSSKPHAELYDSYIYLVLHFPALHHSHKTREQEIDFLIGRDFVITTRYDTVDPLHTFSKVFEVDSLLDRTLVGDHAGYVFFYMLKRLYKAVEHEVEYVSHDLAVIEEMIFSGHEVAVVEKISRVSRDLLNIRQTIEPHREVLRTLEERSPALFGEDFAAFARALSNEYYRVHNHVMRHIDFLHELRETNNSLLSTKQNETMKIFTILAFVTFPLSLIAEIFSTDAIHAPIIGGPYDFWIIIGIMATLTFCMFLYFKHKKWL